MKILDACCGSKLFWFDKNNQNTTYMDIRKKIDVYGKHVNVAPDIQADFRNMPFPDCAFDLVVFDPPHLLKAGNDSVMKKQYGTLDPETWEKDIAKGMSECMRVLKPTGTLIFKWSEFDADFQEVIKIIKPYAPLFGTRRGKRGETIWCVFVKGQKNNGKRACVKG